MSEPAGSTGSRRMGGVPSGLPWGLLMGVLACLAWNSVGSDGASASQEKSDSDRVVRAGRFELVSPDGTVRARISMDPDGPMIRLLDSKGLDQVTLLAFKDGKSRISIIGPSGFVQSGLYAIGAERAGLVIGDEEGNTRVSCDSHRTGGASLTLLDKEGKDTARLPAR